MQTNLAQEPGIRNLLATTQGSLPRELLPHYVQEIGDLVSAQQNPTSKSKKLQLEYESGDWSQMDISSMKSHGHEGDMPLLDQPGQHAHLVRTESGHDREIELD